MYQTEAQLKGTKAHESVDQGTYSDRKDVIMALDVYCEQYGLIGKIDLYYADKGLLVERKRQIKQIYDGYIYQLYGQYFALKEMGYAVKKIQLYSMIDNKKYNVKLPEDDTERWKAFEKLIDEMRLFQMDDFTQENQLKCRNCIYEPACDRSKK